MEVLTPARQLAEGFSRVFDAFQKQHEKDVKIDAEGAQAMAEHGWRSLDEVLADEKPKTADVVAAMMRENTGRSFLDSGGAYGRQFERNQKRAFENEPSAWIEFNIYDRGKWANEEVAPKPEPEIMYTKSVYHWLVNNVDFSPTWNTMFYDVFLPEFDPDGDKYWIDLMLEFALWLKARGWRVDNAPYGEGSVTKRSDIVVNTYNGECALSQTLQYGQFYAEFEGDCEHPDAEIASGVIVLLQIHNGADARGGYTRPIVFEANEPDGMYFYNDGGISCDNPDCHAQWSTDDAYHWYFDGNSRHEMRQQYTGVNLGELGLNLKVKGTRWTPWALYRLLVPLARKYKYEQLADQHKRRIFGIPCVLDQHMLVDRTITLPGKWLPWMMAHRENGIIGKLVELFITDAAHPMFVSKSEETALCPVCHKGHLEADY